MSPSLLLAILLISRGAGGAGTPERPLAGSEVSDGPEFVTGPKYLKDFYGSKAVGVLKAAKKLRVLRLDSDDWLAPRAGGRDVTRVGGIKIVHNSAKDLAPKLVSRFREALLDPATYRFPPPGVGIGNLCVFSPGVLLRVEDRHGSRAEVLLCFSCGDLGIFEPVPPSGRDPRFEDYFRLVDFDEGRFLALLAEALPEDKEIQELMREHKSEE
jgi:hypothetical protein